MSRRIVLLTLAATSLVVVAFLVPLLFLVARVADAREMSQANAEAQTVAAAVGVGEGLDLVLQQVNGSSGRRTTVFQRGGALGAPAERDPAVDVLTASRARVSLRASADRRPLSTNFARLLK